MPSTPSSILRIQLMGNGDQAGTWGETTNTNLGTLLEGAIAGFASVSVTSANQALTVIDYAVDQSRMAIISLSTTTAAGFNVYAPPVSKTYVIHNTSAYTATIYNSTVAGNTTAAGLGVAIPAGRIMTVWSNGTNFYKSNTELVSLSTGVTDTLPVANGGTGATTLTGVLKGNGTGAVTASNVNLASEVTGTLPVANGGTGATTDSGARTNLGLGSMATQNSTFVSISGGVITGITDLAVADGGTGASSITSNQVILGNGSSALNGNLVAPGTSGNVLTSNGTTWFSNALPASATGANVQIFTSSGTFTVPTGVTKLIVDVWGGGGGGANSIVGGTGAAGGSGGYGRAYVSGLTPGASITVTVGGGGNAGAGSGGGGSAGGTSSFGSYLSCTGGNPANGATGGQSGVPTVAGATLLLKSIATNNPVSIPNGGATSGTTGPSCPCFNIIGRGGGGGMSGGGGGADNAAVRSGGSAFGAGSDGAASTLTNGGNGGGSNGGTGSVNITGYYGSGGGGTGGVVVYW
jgi:hypothetical protein